MLIPPKKSWSVVFMSALEDTQMLLSTKIMMFLTSGWKTCICLGLGKFGVILRLLFPFPLFPKTNAVNVLGRHGVKLRHAHVLPLEAEYRVILESRPCQWGKHVWAAVGEWRAGRSVFTRCLLTPVFCVPVDHPSRARCWALAGRVPEVRFAAGLPRLHGAVGF